MQVIYVILLAGITLLSTALFGIVPPYLVGKYIQKKGEERASDTREAMLNQAREELREELKNYESSADKMINDYFELIQNRIKLIGIDQTNFAKDIKTDFNNRMVHMKNGQEQSLMKVQSEIMETIESKIPDTEELKKSIVGAIYGKGGNMARDVKNHVYESADGLGIPRPIMKAIADGVGEYGKDYGFKKKNIHDAIMSLNAPRPTPERVRRDRDMVMSYVDQIEMEQQK